MIDRGGPTVPEPRVVELPSGSSTATQDRPALAWGTDVDAAVARARREGRPLLVHACAAWSVPCTEQRRVLDDARVARAAAPYVTLSIDVTEDTPEANAALSRFGIVGVPGWLLLAPDGREERQTGLQTADALLDWLGAFVDR